jgi:hypothetical protein
MAKEANTVPGRIGTSQTILSAYVAVRSTSTSTSAFLGDS